jgi:hypothetical protein
MERFDGCPGKMGNESMTEPCLITPHDVAQLLGRSVRWVYTNWEKLGGTREFGPLSFFPELVYARLNSAKKRSESLACTEDL